MKWNFEHSKWHAYLNCYTAEKFTENKSLKMYVHLFPSPSISPLSLSQVQMKRKYHSISEPATRNVTTLLRHKTVNIMMGEMNLKIKDIVGQTNDHLNNTTTIYLFVKLTKLHTSADARTQTFDTHQK